MNGNPVEVVRAIGPRRRTKAGVGNEALVLEGSNELVVVVDRLVEQLECHRHFIGPEDCRRVEDLPQPLAVTVLQRSESHREHLIQWSPTTCSVSTCVLASKRSNAGLLRCVAAAAMPDNRCARAQPSSTDVSSRVPSRPSSHIARTSAGYS